MGGVRSGGRRVVREHVEERVGAFERAAVKDRRVVVMQVVARVLESGRRGRLHGRVQRHNSRFGIQKLARRQEQCRFRRCARGQQRPRLRMRAESSCIGEERPVRGSASAHADHYQHQQRAHPCHGQAEWIAMATATASGPPWDHASRIT